MNERLNLTGTAVRLGSTLLTTGRSLLRPKGYAGQAGQAVPLRAGLRELAAPGRASFCPNLVYIIPNLAFYSIKILTPKRIKN
jgi:hypothetical protein